MSYKAFQKLGPTVQISASTTSASAAIPGSWTGARINNRSGQRAWIEFGDSTVVAVASTSLPLESGAVEVLTHGGKDTHVAVVLSAATGTVDITPGEGL